MKTQAVATLPIVKSLVARAERNYNGWKNYPTWAMALWLSNEQGSDNFCYDTVAENGVTEGAEVIKAWHGNFALRHNSDGMAKKIFERSMLAVLDKDPNASIYRVADALKEHADTHNPLTEPWRSASAFTDLLNFGLAWLDYYGFAAGHLGTERNAAIPRYIDVLRVALEMVDWREIAQAYEDQRKDDEKTPRE